MDSAPRSVFCTIVVWLAILTVSCGNPDTCGPSNSEGAISCNGTTFPPIEEDTVKMFMFINGNIPSINATVRPNYPQALQLVVDNCKVASITEDGFKNVPELDTLMIMANPLSNISRQIFSPLEKLTHLSLKSNKISEVPGNVFDDLVSLESVNLEGNQIFSLPKNVFLGNKNLKKVILSKNRLTSIPGQLRELKLLSYLALDENQLGILSEETFKGYGNLTFLAMDECGITKIDDSAFTGVTKLEILNLGFNGLDSLSRTTLQPMRDSLKELYLEGNQLKTLEEGTLPEGLETLRLSENPWHCDENLVWLTKFQNVTCKTPAEFSGMPLSEAAAALANRAKPSRTVLAAAVAIPILVICILLICFILYKIIQNRRKSKRGQVRYSAVYRDTVEQKKAPKQPRV